MATSTTIADYFRQNLQALGGKFQGRITLERGSPRRAHFLRQTLDEKVLQDADLEALEFIFHPAKGVRSGNIYYTRHGTQRSYYLLLGNDRVQQRRMVTLASGKPVYRLLCLESPRGERGTYRWASSEKLLHHPPQSQESSSANADLSAFLPPVSLEVEYVYGGYIV